MSLEYVLSFGGIDLPKWVKVQSISFSALPSITTNERSIVRRHGNVDAGIEIGGYTFSLNVVIDLEDKTIFDRSKELKRFLKGSGWQDTQRLIFEESPDEYYLARASSSADITDIILAGEGNIEFSVPDGKRYALEPTVQTFSVMDFTVDYEGMEDVGTVFTVEIESDVENLTIEDTVTGQALRLEGNFNSGSTVVLNSSKKNIEIDEQVDMRMLTFSSRWLYLREGRNRFSVSTDSGSIGNIQLEYREVN